VNRQLHTETRLLPFTLNTLSVRNLAITSIVLRLTSGQRSAITSIEVHICAGERWFKKKTEAKEDERSFVEGLKLLTGLKKAVVVNELVKGGTSIWFDIWKERETGKGVLKDAEGEMKRLVREGAVGMQAVEFFFFDREAEAVSRRPSRGSDDDKRRNTRIAPPSSPEKNA
jgi:hypothetical protein